MSPYVIWKIGHKSRKNGNNISANIIKWYLRIVYHQDISLLANIGEGASFSHGGIGTVVTGKATIGRNCSIGNNVVIGQIVTSGLEGPRIGDNVFIGAGAKILGAVKIGNNVSIGANSLVLKYVEYNVTVGGVPAKPLQKKIFSVEFNKSEKFKGLVSKELRELFGNKVTIQDDGTEKHLADKLGNSTINSTQLFFNSKDTIQISCTDWSEKLTKEKQWFDQLKVLMAKLFLLKKNILKVGAVLFVFQKLRVSSANTNHPSAQFQRLTKNELHKDL